MPGSPTVLIHIDRKRLLMTTYGIVKPGPPREYFSTHPPLVHFYSPMGIKLHLGSVLEVLNIFFKETVQRDFCSVPSTLIFTTPIIGIICHHYPYLALMSQCGMRGVDSLNHWCQRATKPGRCRVTFSLFHMASMRQKRPLILRVGLGGRSAH